MIIKKEDVKPKDIENCHKGNGVIHCLEYLADYNKTGSGFKFIHDNIIEPGTSIGPHTHEGDEEIYFIIKGLGVMQINGENQEVQSGDVIITRNGQSHSLENTSNTKMRFIVIGCNL